ELDAEASFASKVRSALLELLPSGQRSAEAVAKRLAVSKRTLQRRLADEATTFQIELNQVREQLARHYLANTDLPGAQISFLLGFEDPNSFVRAFHAWTGQTPERLRAQLH
ncbi:MAG: AraC family transcriptional regulator, partial [Deltaproteobacteria bacterium]